MRRRKGPAKRTHYQVLNAGDADSGVPTPENSLSPAIIHFFECDDTTHDDFTGSGETLTVLGTNTTVGAASNTVTLQNWYTVHGTATLTTGWADPNGKDFLIMVCARAEDHGVSPPNAGPISFYMGDGNKQHCRIQAYKGGCQTVDGFFETENTDEAKLTYPLIAGEDYIYCTAYRSGRMEHYATIPGTGGQILYTGDVEVDMSPAKWSPHNGFNCGHGRLVRGGPSTNQDQDTYGFLVVHFTSALPSRSEIISAMEYHLENWVQGNKGIYPGWMSRT